MIHFDERVAIPLIEASVAGTSKRERRALYVNLKPDR
jgi:hypothetical protein